MVVPRPLPVPRLSNIPLHALDEKMDSLVTESGLES